MVFKNKDSRKQHPWHTECTGLSFYLTLASWPSNITQNIRLYVGSYRVVLNGYFIHMKQGSSLKGFILLAFKSIIFLCIYIFLLYTYIYISVNPNLQPKWLLLFITILAPSEQHTIIISHKTIWAESRVCGSCSVWPVLVLKIICMYLLCQISFLNYKLCNLKGNATNIFNNIQECTRLSGQAAFSMYGAPTDLISPKFSCLKGEISSCPSSLCQQTETVISSRWENATLSIRNRYPSRKLNSIGARFFLIQGT